MKCYDFDWQINEFMVYCRSTQVLFYRTQGLCYDHPHVGYHTKSQWKRDIIETISVAGSDLESVRGAF